MNKIKTIMIASCVAAGSLLQSVYAQGSTESCEYLKTLNVSKAKELNLEEAWCAIVPELRELAQAVSLEANVNARLPKPWPTVKNLLSKNAQTDFAESKPSKIQETGFAYDLTQVASKLPTLTEKESENIGRQILVNSDFWWQKAKIIQSQVIVNTLREKAPTLKFSLTRLYPKTFIQGDSTDLLFREKLQLLAPGQVAGYAFLTYRLLSSAEDLLWIYSPANKKTRQLTNANHSDPLFRRTFSLQDIYGYSGNISAVRARAISLSTMLAPFADTRILPLNQVEHCQMLGITEEGLAVGSAPQAEFVKPAQEKNKRSDKIDSAQTPWPNTLRFSATHVLIPRTLFRVELESREPFAYHGRQIIYYDSEYFLPFYKMVYDRKGEAWKFIITSFGLAQSANGSEPYAYADYSVVFDLRRKQVDVMKYNDYRFCSQEQTGVALLADLDPRKLGEP